MSKISVKNLSFSYNGGFEKVFENATFNIDTDWKLGLIGKNGGILSDNMAYLAAFRTNKEFEGKGYFSKLYNFVENDLKERGYIELSLGVGPEAVRNMEIYFL